MLKRIMKEIANWHVDALCDLLTIVRAAQLDSDFLIDTAHEAKGLIKRKEASGGF